MGRAAGSRGRLRISIVGPIGPVLGNPMIPTARSHAIIADQELETAIPTLRVYFREEFIAALKFAVSTNRLAHLFASWES